MAIGLNDENYELVEEFSMMVEMGFFALTGQRYQMVIPEQMTLEVVIKAALTLAQTEDAEYCLHPEYLVAIMRWQEARVWRARLRTWMRGIASAIDDCF